MWRISLKYALIGCGRISPNHIAAAQACGLDIIALCDVDKKQIKNKKEQFGLGDDVLEFTDYLEMLREAQPDIVAIATPSGSHAEIGLASLESGSHTIIEKPITLNLEDAQKLIDIAEKNQKALCACHQNRFNKSIQKIKSAIDKGQFGRLLHGAAHIRWNRGEDYYKQAPWRGTWKEDGGALMNQCIHNIDILRWMMGGEIEEVVAYTDQLIHEFIEAEDLGLALIKFSNGAYGLIEGTTNIYPKNLEETLYIFGEKGTAKASGSSTNLLEVWDFADEKEDPLEVMQRNSELPPNIYGFGHTPLYEDVISAIKNGRKPLVDGEQGKMAVELVLAIYRAAREKKAIQLPLKEASTLENIGRFD